MLFGHTQFYCPRKNRRHCKTIIKEFVGLRAKTYSYITDDGSENEKAERTKMCVMKTKLKFEDYHRQNIVEFTRWIFVWRFHVESK